MDIKYYHAVTSLLEKGYLLNDISAALLMALDGGKRVAEKEETKPHGIQKSRPATKKGSPKFAKKQEKPVKKTEKKPEKKKTANGNPKKGQSVQKRKPFKPNPRKVKNENSNS